MNLQGSEAQGVKILQSQNRRPAKIRLPVNSLRVVHGQLVTCWKIGDGAIASSLPFDDDVPRLRNAREALFDQRARISERIGDTIAISEQLRFKHRVPRFGWAGFRELRQLEQCWQDRGLRA